jgi:hypothetical protein
LNVEAIQLLNLIEGADYFPIYGFVLLKFLCSSEYPRIDFYATPKRYVSLFADHIPVCKLDEFSARFDFNIEEASGKKRNERSAQLIETALSTTGAEILLVESLEEIPVVPPRGSLTGVGLHTGGLERDPTRAYASSVILELACDCLPLLENKIQELQADSLTNVQVPMLMKMMDSITISSITFRDKVHEVDDIPDSIETTRNKLDILSKQ